MRYALYFTPPQDHPLTRAAGAWLGRDAFTGAAVEAQPPPGITAAEARDTFADPRRYGFHATLKAPFRLAEGRDAARLAAALEAFAANRKSFRQQLTPALHAGFFALVPEGPSPALDALAASLVTELDAFRAPLTPAEIARRRPDLLSPDERENLERWGYPHVLGAFAFHMTLTGRVPEPDRERFGRAVDAVFRPLTAPPIAIDAIALFVEPEDGAPFLVSRVFPFGA